MDINKFESYIYKEKTEEDFIKMKDLWDNLSNKTWSEKTRLDKSIIIENKLCKCGNIITTPTSNLCDGCFDNIIDYSIDTDGCCDDE